MRSWTNPNFWGHMDFSTSLIVQEHQYWEVVIMGRKALLFAIITFSYSLGAQLQLLLALGTLFISLLAHVLTNPFLEGGPET